MYVTHTYMSNHHILHFKCLTVLFFNYTGLAKKFCQVCNILQKNPEGLFGQLNNSVKLKNKFTIIKVK